MISHLLSCQSRCVLSKRKLISYLASANHNSVRAGLKLTVFRAEDLQKWRALKISAVTNLFTHPCFVPVIFIVSPFRTTNETRNMAKTCKRSGCHNNEDFRISRRTINLCLLEELLAQFNSISPVQKHRKTVKYFQRPALIDSFYLLGQKEMSLNTKGTGTRYLDCILWSSLRFLLITIACLMWYNNFLLSKMKHLTVPPQDGMLC